MKIILGRCNWTARSARSSRRISGSAGCHNYCERSSSYRGLANPSTTVTTSTSTSQTNKVAGSGGLMRRPSPGSFGVVYFVHPIDVAHDSLCKGRKPPGEIDEADVTIAKDNERIARVWRNGPVYRKRRERLAGAQSPSPCEDPTAVGRGATGGEGGSCSQRPPRGVSTGQNWILGSQRSICSALGYPGRPFKILSKY